MRLHLLFAVFTVVLGCSSRVSDDEIEKWTDENPDGRYSLHGRVERKCTNSRLEVPAYGRVGISEDNSCDNMPPGLSIMQHGYARESFPPLQDTRRLRDIVYYFNCNDNKSRTWKGYEKPAEVEHITPTPRTFGFKRVVSKPEMLKAFAHDVQLTESGNAYVVFLPMLRLNLSTTMTSAAYLAEQVEGYEVSLHNYNPSQQLSLRYRQLPKPFEAHVQEYYKFIRNYGTDIITRTTLGGRFQVLVTNERIKNEIEVVDEKNISSVDVLVNECIRMERNSFTEVTLLVEGGTASSRTNIKDWQREVMMDPIPISPRLLPIHMFLEPHGMTEQKRGLQEIIKLENMNHDMRKVLFQLELLRQQHRLSTFLISLLQGEVNMVCPNNIVHRVIKSGIINPSNIELKLFHVTCTHKRDYYKDQELIVTHSYKLLPGICFTLAAGTAPCIKASMKFPVGVDCLQFFKDKGCSGQVSTKVKTEAEFIKAFNTYENSRSFVLCPGTKIVS